MIRQRRPGADDAAIWSLIQTELIPRSHLKLVPKQIQKELPERLNRDAAFVAENELGHVVGFVNLFRKDRLLYLDMLAVAKSAQGKGYGRQLLYYSECYGMKHHCSEIKMLVDYDNVDAQRFYYRAGYKMVKYIGEVFCYELEKRL
ncbi:GNAT family N-acetyltransferase [Paenibacillus sp. 481]|uniref:GNAT family N-acetyltransferase n=1 Tax=Paenibacillus sp. 481 TaxID=2835869 RepID=UPI001E3E39D5|nr:GNAT family N-acetyltransferase [Paenibacillus sp. 481]UHA72263.1 GNAT family N-acetyltransferase [Paenibacillus sp. 481]